MRSANEDFILPLSQSIRGKDGTMMDTLKVNKGTGIFIRTFSNPQCPRPRRACRRMWRGQGQRYGAECTAINCLNTSTDIWGPDAEDFRPERHFTSKEVPADMAAHRKAVPGVYGSILTFLGGQRNCIGYRFALAEMKVILFVLMRGLVFEELPSKPKIEKKSA